MPLACVPAASWSLGLLLFGGSAGTSRAGSVLGIEQILRGGLVVYVCAILSLLSLSASVFALAPLFDCRRDWRRALQVAAYSGAPVLLGGVILIMPDLAFALLLPCLHGAYLLYGGLQIVLGVKEDQAAEYVALGVVLLTIATTAMGALGAALGIL